MSPRDISVQHLSNYSTNYLFQLPSYLSFYSCYPQTFSREQPNYLLSHKTQIVMIWTLQYGFLFYHTSITLLSLYSFNTKNFFVPQDLFTCCFHFLELCTHLSMSAPWSFLLGIILSDPAVQSGTSPSVLNHQPILFSSYYSSLPENYFHLFQVFLTCSDFCFP